MASLQADWALDRQDREQQRAKRQQFRAMLDEQVCNLNLFESSAHADLCLARKLQCVHNRSADYSTYCAYRCAMMLHQSLIGQVKAGHSSEAVMTKAERDINADLLRQQARLAAGK